MVMSTVWNVGTVTIFYRVTEEGPDNRDLMEVRKQEYKYLRILQV